MDESALRMAIAKFEASRSSFDWWLEFFTVLVVLGVICEVAFVVLEFREDLHDFRRGILHPPDKPSVLLLVFGLFAASLVAVGVAGEFWEEAKIDGTETQIRTANDELYLLLSKEAAQLRVDAEEMKQALAPRRLTLKQRTAISSQLLNFFRQPVVAISNPFDVEASILAAEILSALKSAKWDTVVPHWAIDRNVSSLERAPSIPVTGILVQAAPDKRSQLAAKALVRELSSNGFDSRIPKKGVVGFGPKSDPLIVVDVEARPEGPQGEAKLRAEAKKKQQINSQTAAP
jgi:hypothetical protein